MALKQKCKIKDVLSSEIHINNTLLMRVGDYKHVWLSGQFSDGIIISHYFSPLHGTTPWGWEELICFSVECIPQPEDLIGAAVDLIGKYSDEPWNDSELYALLNDGGIRDVEFMEITFDEFSMRRGDVTHTLVKRNIIVNKMVQNMVQIGEKCWQRKKKRKRKDKEKQNKRASIE